VIAHPEFPPSIPQKQVGASLLKAGLITHAQLKTALQEQKNTGLRLESILVEKGWIHAQTMEYFVNSIVLQHQELEQLRALVRREQPTIAEPPLIKFLVAPATVFRVLFSTILSLTCLHCLVDSINSVLSDYPMKESISRLFNLNIERNIPTFYSTLSLLLCAVLLAIVAIDTKLKKGRYFYHWLGLALLFVFFSCDEFMGLHESLIEPMRQIVKTGGIFRYTWVIPASIAVGVISLTFWKFLFALPLQIRNLFILSGALFVGGGLCLEMLKGYWVDFTSFSTSSIGVLTIFEEFLEMLGIAFFIYALLTYMGSFRNGLTVQFCTKNNQHRSEH
jgi:hypothetical protein